MCNYWHGGTIECRGDGFMWDADCDCYDPDDHSMPCPECNTLAWLESAKETAETTTYMSSYWGGLTGEQVWRNAVVIAVRANPVDAPGIVRRFGVVRPIIDHSTDRAAWIEVICDHRNERLCTSRNKREGTYSDRRKRLAQRDFDKAMAHHDALMEERYAD